MPKLFMSLEKHDARRYHFLLWLKFLTANILFAGVFSLAFLRGWVGEIFAKDPGVSWFMALTTFDVQTLFVTVITAVFLVGLALSFRFAFRVSREINYLKLREPPLQSWTGKYLLEIDGIDGTSRMIRLELFSAKWFNRISSVKYFSAQLVFLGLLGTVIGLSIAFSSISTEAASDTSAFTSMLSSLLTGTGVALYTTIAGAFLGGFWLFANSYILHVGSVDFVTLLGERGEQASSARRQEETH